MFRRGGVKEGDITFPLCLCKLRDNSQHFLGLRKKLGVPKSSGKKEEVCTKYLGSSLQLPTYDYLVVWYVSGRRGAKREETRVHVIANTKDPPDRSTVRPRSG